MNEIKRWEWEGKREYNNAIITLRSLNVEFILQQKASWGHWISKAQKNLKQQCIIVNWPFIFFLFVTIDSLSKLTT